MKKYKIFNRDIILGKPKSKEELQRFLNTQYKLSFDDNDKFHLGGAYNTTRNIFDNSDASKITIVNTCIKVLSDNLSRATITPYKLVKGKKVEDINSPLYNLLRFSPNNYLTPNVLFSYFENYRNSKGNSYAFIKRHKETGYPLELKLIHSDKVVDCKKSNKDGEYYYIVWDDEKKDFVSINSNNILHFKGTITDENGIFGKNPIELARLNLSVIHKATKTSDNFYEKNAFTTKYLQSEPGVYSEDVLSEAVEDYNDKYTGVHSNSNDLIPLPPNTKIQQIPLNLVDVEFIQSIKWNASQIVSLFRVPLHMVGLSDTLKYSSVEQSQIDFITNTMASIYKHYRQELESKLLSEKDRKSGKTIEFDINSLIEYDFKTKTESNIRYLQNAVLSPNEVRADLGLSPIEGGDKHLYQANNLLPLEDIDKNENIDNENKNEIEEEKKEQEKDK